MYEESKVSLQIIEYLRLTSSHIEYFELILTSRSLLLDLADFVFTKMDIGSVAVDNVPMMIRQIGYNSDGTIPVTLMSFQMIPFGNPSGWNPSYEGITGGDTSTITEE